MKKKFVPIVGIRINYSKPSKKASSMYDKCRMIRRILFAKGLKRRTNGCKVSTAAGWSSSEKRKRKLDKRTRVSQSRRRVRTNFSFFLSIKYSCCGPFSIWNFSLISTGQTRRSTRRHDRSLRNFTMVRPKTLHTLSRIRRVVDSDVSDWSNDLMYTFQTETKNRGSIQNWNNSVSSNKCVLFHFL